MIRRIAPFFLPAVCTLLAAATSPAAVVTTADNDSPANDGLTSLMEALTDVQDGETISFNLPGAGPHYILTPLSGYPLIEKSGVVIDGYTQPGSQPNTAAPDLPKNTQLKIVLDSRTDQPNARRTVIDFPGFGLSESCVLGFKDAPLARVRGLAFIGAAGTGSDEDAHVYCIALVSESKDAKIQGCWFGLDPGRPGWTPDALGVVPGVDGARAAVASFKNNGLSSSGLIFGVDGDGTGDRGEGNVCMAQRVAVHLEMPDAVMAGNWINFFPDGTLLNLEKQGLLLEDGTLEIMENGDGTNMRVGTDGNGVSDAEEGNRFGPIVYDTFAEFWRVAPGVVFAGNWIGFGLDGSPAFTTPDSSLIALRTGSAIRIGTDGNGTGDAAETNRVYGIGQALLKMNGPVRIGFRGNALTGNQGATPLDFNAGVSPEVQFADVLADPLLTQVILDPSSTVTSLAGTVPLQAFGTDPPMLDVYLADPFALYDGFSQGRTWLGTYPVDAAADLDPVEGAFRFDIAPLNLSAADLARVTATANYTLPTDPADPVIRVTTNFSEPLQPAVRPPALTAVSLTQTGADLTLAWTGGTPPFRLYSASNPAGPWSPGPLVAGPSALITPAPATRPREFYRIKEGAFP